MKQCRMLKINKELCSDCGTCTKSLPQFKSVYNGEIVVNEWAYDRLEVQKGIEKLISDCESKAITLDLV